MARLFVLAAALAGVVSAQKVSVAFYSESLCPDCQAFNLGSWWDVWNTPGVGGPDGIINYTQVVWGNARLSPSGQITCQHGAEECKMNILQDCAVAHAKGNVSQFIPFIHCLEKFGTQQGQHVSTCAKEWGYDLAALNTCATGPEGKSLILAAAKATPADHQYVPWTTVNGKNICLDSDPPATPCYLLLKSVCDAYVPPAGGSKPAACSSERASLADW